MTEPEREKKSKCAKWTMRHQRTQVPDNVTDAAAVFAEPLAAACRIVEQGLVPSEATAAVLGDGKLGLLIAEVLARRPSGTGGLGGTTIIGRHKEKMDLCCTRLTGLDGGGGGEEELGKDCGDVKEEGPEGKGGLKIRRVNVAEETAVEAMTGGFDVVVDATGSPTGLASASQLCRPMGCVCVFSWVGGYAWGCGHVCCLGFALFCEALADDVSKGWIC